MKQLLRFLGVACLINVPALAENKNDFCGLLLQVAVGASSHSPFVSSLSLYNWDYKNTVQTSYNDKFLKVTAPQVIESIEEMAGIDFLDYSIHSSSTPKDIRNEGLWVCVYNFKAHTHNNTLFTESVPRFRLWKKGSEIVSPQL